VSCLFPAIRGGPFDLANSRQREWGPAVEGSGVRLPTRIYDLRSRRSPRWLSRDLDRVADDGVITGHEEGLDDPYGCTERREGKDPDQRSPTHPGVHLTGLTLPQRDHPITLSGPCP